MKFSVVITTYNRLAFLKRAIASCQQQTVPCEIVVVDDNSSDDTEAYARSLGDAIVYQRNPQNLGHSGSVNVGVDAASGDWIKFLDDDDYLAPTCLERMLAAIVQCPQAVLCSCQAIQVDADEKELKRTKPVSHLPAFYIPQSAIHYSMLLDQAPLGTPVQVAAQRAAFLKTGGWDTTMSTNYDDIDAWIRIAEHGDVVFLNEYLAYRTIWTGGFEQRADLRHRMNLNIEIKRRILERVQPPYQDKCPTLPNLSRYLHLHWGLVALKQRKFRTAAEFCFPAILYPNTWKYLIQARSSRHQAKGNPAIPTQALTMPP